MRAIIVPHEGIGNGCAGYWPAIGITHNLDKVGD